MIHVFVDGSYNKRNPNIIRGGVVIVDLENKNLISIRHVYSYKPFLVKSRNVGGEVIAALVGIINGFNIINPNESIIVHHDYNGTSNWVTGEKPWDANTETAVFYKSSYNDILNKNPEKQVLFNEIKAHSGIFFNELADKVAKKEIPPGFKKYQLEDIEV